MIWGEKKTYFWKYPYCIQLQKGEEFSEPAEQPPRSWQAQNPQESSPKSENDGKAPKALRALAPMAI